MLGIPLKLVAGAAALAGGVWAYATGRLPFLPGSPAPAGGAPPDANAGNGAAADPRGSYGGGGGGGGGGSTNPPAATPSADGSMFSPSAASAAAPTADAAAAPAPDASTTASSASAPTAVQRANWTRIQTIHATILSWKVSGAASVASIAEVFANEQRWFDGLTAAGSPALTTDAASNMSLTQARNYQANIQGRMTDAGAFLPGTTDLMAPPGPAGPPTASHIVPQADGRITVLRVPPATTASLQSFANALNAQLTAPPAPPPPPPPPPNRPTTLHLASVTTGPVTVVATGNTNFDRAVQMAHIGHAREGLVWAQAARSSTNPRLTQAQLNTLRGLGYALAPLIA